MNIKFRRQKRLPFYYKGEYLCSYVPDLLIPTKDGDYILELKHKASLDKRDEIQLQRYLFGMNESQGSLINFQTAEEVIPFLDYAAEQRKPIIIISNMQHDISDMILTNVVNHKHPFCIIKPPYIGKKGRETMSDLALVLGCEVLQGITRTHD